MTLFTAEGLLGAYTQDPSLPMDLCANELSKAYLRWLETQTEASSLNEYSDEQQGLMALTALHHQRSPGNTCLSALRDMDSLGDLAINESKGCGGVMRVVPVGLLTWRLGLGAEHAFKLGCLASGLTHGHPTGKLAAGALASIIYLLMDNCRLDKALSLTEDRLRQEADHHETLTAIQQARTLAHSATPPYEAIQQLGEGWIAEEALAISIYCAIAAQDFEDGIIMAVNHDGDSDSTGAIAGHLLALLHGYDDIPKYWLESVELKTVIEAMADQLLDS